MSSSDSASSLEIDEDIIDLSEFDEFDSDYEELDPVCVVCDETAMESGRDRFDCDKCNGNYCLSICSEAYECPSCSHTICETCAWSSTASYCSRCMDIYCRSCTTLSPCIGCAQAICENCYDTNTVCLECDVLVSE